MGAYELMLSVNRFMVCGGVPDEGRRRDITCALLAERSDADAARRFYDGVRYPGNADADGRRLYPRFFIPPYNGGKKYRTLLGQTPKTQLFSSNMYELEIIRLLWLLRTAENDGEITELALATLGRLQTTCFGASDDGVGECFDANLVVLRYLAAVTPNDVFRVRSRIDSYNNHKDDKRRPWFSHWYYQLCLSELPLGLVRGECDKYRDEMERWLREKSCVMNSDEDRRVHPMLFCVLRNALARYPELAYIAAREPFVAEKDGRLHFDMSI